MNERATVGVLDQLQTDIVAFWQRLPNKLFFTVLFTAWLALFQFIGNSTFGYIDSPSLFEWMWNAYTYHLPEGGVSDNSIGIWVPIVVLALLWMKRDQLVQLRLRTWWPGLLLVACGLVFHVIGYSIQQPRVSILGMLIGIYGLMGLTWGYEFMRGSFFPFFLLIFCIPFSGPLESVTFRLRLLACQIVEVICHTVLGIEVIRDGTILRDPGNSYQYEVAAACSGIRSLVAIGLMATIGAFLYLRAGWRRLALMISAIPLAVLGNVVRLLTIIITAEIGGQQAGNYVHEGGPLGIISLMPYLLAFFGLMWIGKWLKEPEVQEAEAR